MLAPDKAIVERAFKRPDDLPRTCSDEALLEAVQLWLCGGDQREVARLLSCKPSALTHWTSAAGWRFLEDALRDNIRQIAHVNLTRIAHRCFGLINERIERGDPIYGLEGEVVGYRAVRVKDLGNLAAQMLTQGNEIEKRLGKKGAEKDLSLEDLAESLQNYVKQKRFDNAKEIDASPIPDPPSAAVN